MQESDKRSLHYKTFKYWQLSSYWRGRVELPVMESWSTKDFMAYLQKMLYEAGAHWKLLNCIGDFLNAVIYYGRYERMPDTILKDGTVVDIKTGRPLPAQIAVGERQLEEYKSLLGNS